MKKTECKITVSDFADDETVANIGVSAIIEKWYKKLAFPKEYDKEFYKALNEPKISELISIDKYDVYSKDGKRNLLSALYMCEWLAEKYSEKEIGETVLCDTLSDIVIWTNVWTNLKGELYLGQLDWLKRHLQMSIFKLGRLQFCMGTAECDISKMGVKKGDNVLEIHIPEGESLLKEKCLSSIETAKKFFAEYFPEFKYKCIICHSWMLDETLENFLRADSNILQFQKMFEIVHKNESDAILRYVFKWDTTRNNLRYVTADSSFAKAIKSYTMNDGCFFEATGVLK